MAKTKTDQSASNFDALFGARAGETVVSGGFKMIPHDRIAVLPQVRQTFAPDEVEELRGSIHELKERGQGIEGSGVLQALLVCPSGDGYRLLAGEKRFRATQAEGLAAVPCVIVTAPGAEGTVRLLQLTENLLRSDPPPLEEARALVETMEADKLSMRDLARALGKTLGYVSNRTALLKMDDDVKAMVTERADTLRVAAHINKVEDVDLRAALIEAVTAEHIGEREVLQRIKDASTDVDAQEQSAPSETDESSPSSSAEKAAKAPSAPSLRPVVRAAKDAIESIRTSVLSEPERQKVRDDRDALAVLLEELDEIMG